MQIEKDQENHLVFKTRVCSCQRDVRYGKSLSAGNVQPHGKKTASCSGLPVAFPAGVDNIRSHLSRIMFYLLFHKEITQILAECISGVAITHPMKPVGAAIFGIFYTFLFL